MLPPEIELVVHATHEAGAKVGGIGAVLDGILAEPTYNQVVRRTVLVGPFNPSNLAEMERIYSPGNGFHAIYSTLDGIANVSAELAHAFEQIELYYHVNLLYGKRRFGNTEHEVLLIDPREVVASVVNLYKYQLWSQFGIDSRRYEDSPDYEWYVRAAEPSFAALQALVGQGEYPRPPRLRAAREGRAVLLAHEWLGLPLAFSARSHEPGCYATAFYAHEVATVRRLVENNPGHDTRLYNVMHAARRQGLYLEDVFGDQRDFFKHALLMAAANLDGIFAVSDVTLDELRFLSPAFANRPIALVYNGVPSPPLTLVEHQASKARMQQYGENLTGRRPTWVFTHVTRLVPSKGLWRDLRVMEQLDRQLAAQGESALLFTLSSALPVGRRVEEVLRWETEYDWPLVHHAGNGDLIGLEVDYNRAIEEFNARALASRIILFNQYGWGDARCGQRMPADMQPTDIRYGTDLEFGQSIYEPFGIGQLEPLATGALCCVSSICGCVGFIKQVGGMKLPNVVVADYVTLPPRLEGMDLASLLAIGQHERDMVEVAESARVANKIFERLPRGDAAAQSSLEAGFALSQRMSWKVVVEEGLIPALAGLF
jgi:glycosyltransferase involved in cell wall biosynthesis